MIIKGNTGEQDYLVPTVIEDTGRGERSFDIFSRLLKERIVFINGEINDDLSSLVIAQLLFLEAEDPDKDVNVYINSPGGVITAGLAIYDTMNYIKPDIVTICVGQAASMAAVLLAAGSKGKRMALPNARMMLHQPLGGAQGQASDIEIHAKEILYLRERLNKILAEKSGQTLKKIQADTERDFFMSADEAIKYGLIDTIIKKKK